MISGFCSSEITKKSADLSILLDSGIMKQPKINNFHEPGDEDSKQQTGGHDADDESEEYQDSQRF